VGLVGVGSAIGLFEQGGVGAPLDVDCVADDKGVLGDDLEAAGASPSGRLDDLSKHLAEGGLAADDLAVGAEELDIFRELRHEAGPVAAGEGGHVLFDHFGGGGLTFERRHGLGVERGKEWGAEAWQNSERGGGKETQRETRNRHTSHDSAEATVREEEFLGMGVGERGRSGKKALLELAKG